MAGKGVMIIDLLLIRHGETTWNQERRYQGQQDSPLSELGLEQAEKTAAYLRQPSIDAIYTSDLLRAKVTAEVIGRPHGLSPIEDERLREISFGVWEGLTRAEVQAKYPQIFADRFRDTQNVRVPGGELPGEVVDRLMDFVSDLVSKHGNHRVACISHGGSLRLLLAALLGLPLEKSYCFNMSNAGISHLSFNPQQGPCLWQVH